MKVLIGFQIVLVGFYFYLLGWKKNLVPMLMLIGMIILYRKNYHNITVSYIAFNIFSIVDMVSSLFIFGLGFGFEYYIWFLFGAVLYVPFISKWKIRFGIALAYMILWEIVSFVDIEPMISSINLWKKIGFQSITIFIHLEYFLLLLMLMNII